MGVNKTAAVVKMAARAGYLFFAFLMSFSKKWALNKQHQFNLQKSDFGEMFQLPKPISIFCIQAPRKGENFWRRVLTSTFLPSAETFHGHLFLLCV